MSLEHLESFDCWCEPRVEAVGEHRIIVHHPEEWRQYTAFRRDGWPFCPRCGEDELWTPWTPEGEEASLDDYIANKLSCLRCEWRSV